MNKALAKEVETLTDNSLEGDLMNGSVIVPTVDSRYKNLTSWQPGQSGNPAGRPKGSRNKLCEDFLDDLHKAWKNYGKKVFKDVARDDPAKMLSCMVQVLPKDFQLHVDIDQVTWVINASPRLTEDEWVAKHALAAPVVDVSDDTT